MSIVDVTARLEAHPAPATVTALWAVIRRGLLDRRRSILAWGGSIGGYGGFMTAIYPSIQSSIAKLVKSYPAGLKQAFGVETMSTIEGYIHAEMFSLIVPLALAFFAIRVITSTTVAAEEHGQLITSTTVAAEEHGQLDTILSLPLSRSALLIGSYVVAAAGVLTVMAVTGIMMFVVGRIAGTSIAFGSVAAGVMGVCPLALFFAGVAALASGLLHSSRTVTGVAIGVLIAMYAFDVAGRLASGLEPLRWASAFRYYGAPMRNGIDPAALIGLIGVGLGLLFVGARLLEHRDLMC